MKTSAGLLMYRIINGELQLLLAHPGGPHWEGKDLNAWSIPKGEIEEGETDFFEVALREFSEETGITPKGKTYFYLGTVKQRSGKIVHCWAFEGSWDSNKEPFKSNTCTIEWPLNSGHQIIIPEIDKLEWVAEKDLVLKMNLAQQSFITELKKCVKLS